ncbi:MAG: alpha/beta hydrolase, partial [Victivallales bacterium]|nr:alpha/beta hydrolase [Victivallales bacterium]
AAGGCEISGPNTGSSVTVLYRAWHASSASVTCSVTIEPTNEFGTGTGRAVSQTVFLPVWSVGRPLSDALAGAAVAGGSTRVAAPGQELTLTASLPAVAEEDRRDGATVTFPSDPVVFASSASTGTRGADRRDSASGGGSPAWSATAGEFPDGSVGQSVAYRAPGASGTATVSVTVDDRGEKPVNEAGTADDAPMSLPSVTVIVPGVSLQGDCAAVRLNRDDDDGDLKEDRTASAPHAGDDDVIPRFTMSCTPDGFGEGTFSLGVDGDSRVRLWLDGTGGEVSRVQSGMSWGTDVFFALPSRALRVEGINASEAVGDVELSLSFAAPGASSSQTVAATKSLTVVDVWLGIDVNGDGHVTVADEAGKATEAGGRHVLLNDDDDDGNGVADLSDLSDQGCGNAEDDLVPIRLSFAPASFSTATLSATSGGQCIRLWSTATKTGAVNLPATFTATAPVPDTLYAEGVAEGDCVLRLACGEPHSDIYDEVRLRVVRCNLGLDANRDGEITFGQYGTGGDGDPQNPFLFWVNDDHDCKDSKDGVDDAQDDYETSARDCDDDRIGNGKNGENWCERDLEDFTVLGVQLSQSLVNDTSVTLGFEIQADSGADTPAVNLFPFKGILSTNDHLFDYLSNSTKAKNQANATRLAAVSGAFAAVPSTDFIDKGGICPFLLEGASAGTGKLRLVVRRNGHDIAKRGVRLALQNIDWFYDYYKVSLSGGSGWQATVEPTATRIRKAEFHPRTPAKKLLFVHGWNMLEWEKERWAETAFKRLWWLGYDGGFTLFSWPTRSCFSKTNAIVNPGHYNDSEFIAWNSSRALCGLLSALNKNDAQLTVLAHSMGNVVAGEALRRYSGRSIFRYIASQAAVPAEAYDSSWALSPYSAEIFPSFLFGTPDAFGHYHTGQPPSPPYFLPNIGKCGRIDNFYNASDYALRAWGWNNFVKPHSDTEGGTFAYSGSTSHYDDSDLESNSFHRYHTYTMPVDDGAGGITYQTHETIDQWYHLGDSYDSPAERYWAFAYVLQSRSKPLGKCPVALTGGVNLQGTCGFDDKHYSHSRQFRSSASDTRNYWLQVLNPPSDGGRGGESVQDRQFCGEMLD